MSPKSVTVWSVSPEACDPAVLEKAALVVRSGGVVVYPTETFYGLGADPFSGEALERVYRIKGRDFQKPLPLIASDRQAVRRAVSRWPEAAEELAEAFWPGPLTLVLQAASELPPRLHAHTGTVAIRISPHPVAQGLAREAGGLLTATSANRAGEPPLQDLDTEREPLLDQVDALVYAGETPGGLPSTIVHVGGEDRSSVRLLRPGCLPWEAVAEILVRGAPKRSQH